MKRIMGFFLALVMVMGCMSLNPIASYANDTDTITKTFNINNGNVNITQSGNYTITGTGQPTSNTISVTGNDITATITLNNVNIDIPNSDIQPAFRAKGYGQSNIHLTIKLKGTNSLKSSLTAGLYWTNSDDNSTDNSTLEIKGDGSLTATSRQYGAGIGGGNQCSGDNITITGGTVTATGGEAVGQGGGAAGIGGGSLGSGKNITITGGTVTATGGNNAAGIGGGKGGSGKNITITGGTVTATGGDAGIGGGSWGAAQHITITGGSVKASRIGTTPTDSNGNSVYLAKLENQDGVNEVTVDSGTANKKTFTRADSHPGSDTAFYLYLTGQDHDLVTSKGIYEARWNSNTNGFTIIEFTIMEVKEQPKKLTYTEGDKLDLTGLSVTLDDGLHFRKVVPFAALGDNNIATDPKDGTELKLENDGKPVTLKRGNLTATTGALQVKVRVFDSTHVKSMSVTHQPSKLTYTEDDKLDLTGLVVTLTDDHGKTKEVKPADFTANNITATPENGAKLKLANNGKKVKLTRGSLAAETSNALTVNERVFDPHNVKTMTVASQPTRLTYTEDDKLDLTGLVVTLIDGHSLTKEVTPAEFEANGIKANPENGTELTVADNNGKPVKLTKDGVSAVETEKLTVNAISASADAEDLAAAEAAHATVAMYRLYNTWTHEHLFTTDKAEYDNLVAAGWTGEGEIDSVAAKQGKGVYRLYNPYTHEHHYTSKEDEVADCVKAGWVNEGIKFHSVQNGTVPVYSMYNPNEQKFYHHYTSDPDEIAKMVKDGWIKEEIKWYATSKK